MNTTSSPKKQKKRRNCYDRMRTQLLNASRRSSRADPAVSATLQLLAIFTVIFGRLPSITAAPSYTPYTPPCRTAKTVQRADMAQRLGVPIRYLDLVLSRGEVPHGVLFEHIRQGGVMRRDAMIELRKHAPDASLVWLNYIQKQGRWSDLIRCLVPDEGNDDVDVKLLKYTLAWLNHSAPDQGGCLPDGSAENCKPSSTSIDPENEDDPTKPKL